MTKKGEKKPLGAPKTVGKARVSDGAAPTSAESYHEKSRSGLAQKKDGDLSIPSNLTELIIRGNSLAKDLHRIEEEFFLERRAVPDAIPRPKTSWDYVLDEGQWLSIDFRQELRWKRELCAALADVAVEHLQKSFPLRRIAALDKSSLATTEQVEVSTVVTEFVAQKFQSMESQNSSTALALFEPTRREEENVEKLIERVLSLSATSASQSSKQLIKAKSDNNDLLINHQRTLLVEIEKLAALNLGVVVYGSAFSGKTVAVATSLLKSMTHHHEQTALSTLGLIIGSKKVLFRWQLILKKHFSDVCSVTLWVPDVELPSGHNVITLVSLDDHVTFHEWMKTHALEDRYAGAVVDLRASVTFDRRTSTLPKKNSEQALLQQAQEQKNLLVSLSKLLPPCKRIMIADDNLRSIDRLSTLAVLLPSVTFESLEKRLNPDPLAGNNHAGLDPSLTVDAMLSAGVVPIEQINRNTINQMLINISAHASVPAEVNARAYAQVREEIVSLDLTPSQQEKYDEIGSQLMVNNSTLFTGESVHQLARASSVLKLICFHGKLADKLDMMNAKHRATSPSLEDNVRIKPGFLSQHGNVQTDINLSADSNKLKALKTQLERFRGLRVVVVASEWIELHLVHRFLAAEGVAHSYPSLLLQDTHHPVATTPVKGSHDENPDALLNWFAEEINTQMFNDSSVLSCVLLTTAASFKSPSAAPWLADAIIMVSFDWSQYLDMKNCFRLRLIDAGPSGDPVTVVRLCSKSTIEEIMIKNKSSIPSLQGLKVAELSIIPKHKQREDITKVLSSTIFLSNAPVLHTGRRSVALTVANGHQIPTSPPRRRLFGLDGNLIDSDSQNNSGNESGSHSSMQRRNSGAGMMLTAQRKPAQPFQQPQLTMSNKGGYVGTSGNSSAMEVDDATTVPHPPSNSLPTVVVSTSAKFAQSPSAGLATSSKETAIKWLDIFHNVYQESLLDIVYRLATTGERNKSHDDTVSASIQLMTAELTRHAMNIVINQAFSALRGQRLNDGVTLTTQIADETSLDAAQVSKELMELRAASYKFIADRVTALRQKEVASISNLQRLRAVTVGQGLSDKERRLQRLFLPDYTEALSEHHAGSKGVSNEVPAVIGAPAGSSSLSNNAVATAPITHTNGTVSQSCALPLAPVLPPTVSHHPSMHPRPVAFQQFRDSVHEMSRLGVTIEPWLYNSPLNSATRYDTVVVPSYLKTTMDAVHRYDRENTMQITYYEKSSRPPVTYQSFVARVPTPAVNSTQTSGSTPSFVDPINPEFAVPSFPGQSIAASLTAPVTKAARKGTRKTAQPGSASGAAVAGAGAGSVTGSTTGGGRSTKKQKASNGAAIVPTHLTPSQQQSAPAENSFVSGGMFESHDDLDMIFDNEFSDLHNDSAIISDIPSSSSVPKTADHSSSTNYSNSTSSGNGHVRHMSFSSTGSANGSEPHMSLSQQQQKYPSNAMTGVTNAPNPTYMPASSVSNNKPTGPSLTNPPNFTSTVANPSYNSYNSISGNSYPTNAPTGMSSTQHANVAYKPVPDPQNVLTNAASHTYQTVGNSAPSAGGLSSSASLGSAYNSATTGVPSLIHPSHTHTLHTSASAPHSTQLSPSIVAGSAVNTPSNTFAFPGVPASTPTATPNGSVPWTTLDDDTLIILKQTTYDFQQITACINKLRQQQKNPPRQQTEVVQRYDLLHANGKVAERLKDQTVINMVTKIQRGATSLMGGSSTPSANNAASMTPSSSANAIASVSGPSLSSSSNSVSGATTTSTHHPSILSAGSNAGSTISSSFPQQQPPQSLSFGAPSTFPSTNQTVSLSGTVGLGRSNSVTSNSPASLQQRLQILQPAVSQSHPAAQPLSLSQPKPTAAAIYAQHQQLQQLQQHQQLQQLQQHQQHQLMMQQLQQQPTLPNRAPVPGNTTDVPETTHTYNQAKSAHSNHLSTGLSLSQVVSSGAGISSVITSPRPVSTPVSSTANPLPPTNP